MKIQIPHDVTFVNPLTGMPVVLQGAAGKPEVSCMSFREFYLNLLGNDPRLATVPGARMLREFHNAVEAAQDGVAEIDPAVHKFMKSIVENPRYVVQTAHGTEEREGFLNYRGIGVMQLLPFVDAIENAQG